MNASENPLLADWTAPFGAPPLDRDQAGAFPAGLRAGAGRRTGPRSPRSRLTRPRRISTTPWRRWSARGGLLARVSNVFYVLAGAHTSEPIQAIERDMAPTLARHWNEIHLNEALFARLDALHGRAATPRPHAPSRRGCWSAITRCSAAPARASMRAAKERLKEIGDRLASARHDVRPERARRRAVLRAAARARTISPGLPDFARAAARGAAEERGLKGHAVTLEPLQRRAVPAILRAAATCARRRSAPGSRAATMAARPTTTADHRRADRAARREGAPARLSELRALQARRHDGEDAGRRDRPARCRLGAGAPPRRPGARRPAGDGDGRGRQFPPRAVGLALLRREAAQGALRPR